MSRLVLDEVPMLDEDPVLDPEDVRRDPVDGAPKPEKRPWTMMKSPSARITPSVTAATPCSIYAVEAFS